MLDPTHTGTPAPSPRFERRPAPPSLQDAVDSFWLMHIPPSLAELGPATHGKRELMLFGPDGVRDPATDPGYPGAYHFMLVIPDGALDIQVVLPYLVAGATTDVPRTAYARVMLAMRHTLDAAFHIPSSIFVIRFHIGGARDFFPTSIDRIADRPVPLEELWGTTAEEFVREIERATSLAELAEIAERYLASVRREPSEGAAIVRRCVAELQRVHGGMPIERLQEIAGTTERQLERLFKEHVGLTPKRLARTLRLGYLLQSVERLDEVDWHDLIVILNYCDQPHLIREFKDFVGMTPAAYLKQVERHIAQKKRLGIE